jgi:hypothetical protein
MMADQRQCPRCGVTKTHEFFDKSTYKRDGLATYCKECRHAKQAGVKRGWSRWANNQLATLATKYRDTPNRVLAGLLNRNVGAIQVKARSLGLTKTFIINPRKRCPKNRRYSTSDNLFKAIGPSEAYVIGYLLADGCLLRPKKPWHTPCEFTYTSKDIELIHKVSAAIGSTYPVKEYVRPWRTYYRVTVSNADAYGRLVETGLTAAKTHSATLPKVPGVTVFHMLRGYFDGDGSAVLAGGCLVISFTSGSPALLEQINNYVHQKLGFSGRITKYKSKNASQLAFSGPRALALADAMYRDAGELYLLRKKDVVERYRMHRTVFHRVPGATTKRCYECEVTKPLADFGRCRSRKDGVGAICLSCKREWSRRRRRKQIS